MIKYGNVKTLWIGNFRVAQTRINTNNKIISGLKIIEMENAGPLYDKGVRANDIIISINDENANWNNLISSLKFATLGKNLKLDLISNNVNQLKTIDFKPTT